MCSRKPKLLHVCAGVPLIEHVVRAVAALEPTSLKIVVAAADEQMQAALQDCHAELAFQAEPTGTADAVAAGVDALGDVDGTLLVVNGDCPGVRTSTLAFLVKESVGAAATVLAVEPIDPSGSGRLLRDGEGNLQGIVEEADAGDEASTLTEVNGGVCCFDLSSLRGALPRVDTDNAQSERYLTQVFKLLADDGAVVRGVSYGDAEELYGVNSRAELARAEGLLRRRKLRDLMAGGVTVRDPQATYVDVDVEVGADTTLHPGVTLEGDTRIGEGCEVRSSVRISNSRVGDGVNVFDGSIIEDSSVGDDANLGPYARLRPGSDIGAGAKVGNFVETKATRLGDNSKASHLSYLGNARIGNNVNIGAGTITCNYDGAKKYETVIDDGAFIGSNTALVAPVRVGKNAYVGAGSTITEDVPDRALGLARGRQVNKLGWAEKD